MFKQLKLPFGGKGEAPMAKRSEEVCAAAKGSGRSGTSGLMAKFIKQIKYRLAVRIVTEVIEATAGPLTGQRFISLDAGKKVSADQPGDGLNGERPLSRCSDT
jgi:predicted GTPase